MLDRMTFHIQAVSCDKAPLSETLFFNPPKLPQLSTEVRCAVRSSRTVFAFGRVPRVVALLCRPYIQQSGLRRCERTEEFVAAARVRPGGQTEFVGATLLSSLAVFASRPHRGTEHVVEQLRHDARQTTSESLPSLSQNM